MHGPDSSGSTDHGTHTIRKRLPVRGLRPQPIPSWITFAFSSFGWWPLRRLAIQRCEQFSVLDIVLFEVCL